MDMLEMDLGLDGLGLLEDGWTQAQIYHADHFDDLKVAEAGDGLHELDVPPRTPDGITSTLCSPTHVSLGEEWMEQDLGCLLDGAFISEDPSSLPIIAEPIQSLDDEYIAVATETLVIKSEPSADVGSFLQNLLEENAQSLTLHQCPASPAPSSPEAQVAPEIDFSADVSPAFLQSPLSPDDVESIFSATTSSPSSPSTVDTSSLYTDEGALVCDTSDLYEVVTNTKPRHKSAPYSRPQASKGTKSKGRKQTASLTPNPSELELVLMSKKDRKKLQNKNAAIRYRMKKKEESLVKRTEEEELEIVNQTLHEKVADLTREIKYMTNLINEVRKARGQPLVTA